MNTHMSASKNVINAKDLHKKKEFNIFEVPRNTRQRKHLFDDERKTKSIKPPRRLEENPDWIRITDAEEFKRIFPLVVHQDADYLDEWAVYVHKLDPSYRVDRFKDYKMELIEEIGVEKCKNIFYDNKVDHADLTYYEVEKLLADTLNLNIVLDDEEGTFSLKEDQALSKGLNWSVYDKEELKSILRKKKLAVSGTKKQLIERLEINKHLFQKDLDGLVFTKGKEWEEYSKEELQNILVSRGLSTDGEVMELLIRIEENKDLF